MAQRLPIPSSPKLPVVGHLHQVREGQLQEFLARKGAAHPEGIFTIWFTKFPVVFVTDPDLVAELSDERRFRKLPTSPITELRAIAGDGLFTAYSSEPNWGKAHRILMPAFSQRAMRGYFGLIRDVTEEMVGKWAALGDRDVEVSDDMTRLTLESIARAGFGQGFDSFGREALDPFLQAIGVALERTTRNMMRLPIQRRFAPKSEAAAFAAAVDCLNDRVDEVIAQRRGRPDPDAQDLLNLMLTALDPETGERLDDVNIRYQVLTFLVAGHETTSNLLTFALHLLMRHPEVMARAYAEVDNVLPGDTRIEYRHIAQLDVISRVLDEALRLWPPAPGYTVAPYADEVIGAGYAIAKDRPVNISIPGLHRNPGAWTRPDEFDIDRWTPERRATQHPHAYKPFGNGERACIGRQFALLEAKLVLAVVLQKFALHDPYSYRLQVRDMLTIKPENFLLRVRRRTALERLGSAVGAAPGVSASPVAAAQGRGRRLTVLYGTSLGTSRDVAEQIAARAVGDGFEAVAMPLDAALTNPPEQEVLVVVTATYNGRAPDSAVALERAIAAGGLADARWPGLKYAVLGVGDSQWPNFQAFPRLLDEALAAAGGERLVARGEADASADFDGAVEAFIERLWRSLGGGTGVVSEAGLGVTLLDPLSIRQAVLPGEAAPFEVVGNRELVTPAPDGLWDFALEAPRTSTRHVTLRLPPGVSYKVGDHLAVYARNQPELAGAALAALGVDGDILVRLDGAAARLRHLPVDQVMPARRLLEDYVDLQEPASRRAVQRLVAFTRCPVTRAAVERLAGDDYDGEVAGRRVSLLGLMRAHPALEVGFSDFVALSPAIQPRFYSIASSPRVSPDAVDLLVGSLRAPAWSGHGQHLGLASNHVCDAQVGDRLLAFVRTPNPPFAPPADPGVPLVLVGPGAGLAPFRGFLQDRAALRRDGVGMRPAQLFFGCRHPDHDWLHREELEAWSAQGDVELHLAFSALPSHPYRFVQDALWAQGDAVWAALEQGGVIYVCGDGKVMAPAVRDTLIRIHMRQTGASHADSSGWLEGLIQAGRYHQDVFGFGK